MKLQDMLGILLIHNSFDAACKCLKEEYIDTNFHQLRKTFLMCMVLDCELHSE